MTSVATDALADALTAYAGRFHAAVGPRHHVASPLGAWLLLALVAAADAGGGSAGATHTAAADATPRAADHAAGAPRGRTADAPTEVTTEAAAGAAAEAAGRGATGMTDQRFIIHTKKNSETTSGTYFSPSFLPIVS